MDLQSVKLHKIYHSPQLKNILLKYTAWLLNPHLQPLMHWKYIASENRRSLLYVKTMTGYLHPCRRKSPQRCWKGFWFKRFIWKEMLRWARAPSGLSEATNDKSIHSMRSFSLENQVRIFAAASEVARKKVSGLVNNVCKVCLKVFLFPRQVAKWVM